MFKKSTGTEIINTGRWNEKELDSILEKSFHIDPVGDRIAFLSGLFSGTVYKGSTLTGDAQTTEVFVIDLGGVDCFTFLDYIEAMRLSDRYSDFKENLKKIRYRNSMIAFEKRNHFFTDWREFNPDLVDDITSLTGGDKTLRTEKRLNLKEDKTLFLPGIPVAERAVDYIPSPTINDHIMSRLQTGDYAGIYSEIKGLDVSHVGIIIRAGNSIYLRHASSVFGKVVDEDFRSYMENKPGLVLLRPKT